MKRCARDFIRTLGLSLGLSGLIIAAASVSAVAQKKYDTGASDTEIRIGNIMPYSGPASAYGIIGKTMSAYFRMINDNGGINGRKVNFISYDDAYSPPKTVEQARKLVESDEVFLIFAPLGTAPNAAIQKYMNTMKVPRLFVATGVVDHPEIGTHRLADDAISRRRPAVWHDVADLDFGVGCAGIVFFLRGSRHGGRGDD